MAGRLVGFRFVACRIGPLMVKRTRRGLHIGLSTGIIFGGYVLCVPTQGRHLRRRYAVFVIGGPLATILWIAGLIGLALFLLVFAVSAPKGEAIAALACEITWVNVVIWMGVLVAGIIKARAWEAK